MGPLSRLVVVSGLEAIHDAVWNHVSLVGRLLVVGPRCRSIRHMGRLEAIFYLRCLEVVLLTRRRAIVARASFIKSWPGLGSPLRKFKRIAGNRVVISLRGSRGGWLVSGSSGSGIRCRPGGSVGICGPPGGGGVRPLSGGLIDWSPGSGGVGPGSSGLISGVWPGGGRLISRSSVATSGGELKRVLRHGIVVTSRALFLLVRGLLVLLWLPVVGGSGRIGPPSGRGRAVSSGSGRGIRPSCGRGIRSGRSGGIRPSSS